MSTLDRQIDVAQGRIRSNLFAEGLTLAITLAAAAWVAYVLVVRLAGFAKLPVWSIGAGLVGLALIGATVAVLLRRIDRIRAAAEIDRAAGLKERLSSAAALKTSPDPFAVATRQDAERTAANIHVPTHLPLQTPARLPGAILALVAALLLAWLLPSVNWGKDKTRDPNALVVKETALEEKKNVEEALLRQRNRIRELSEKNPELKDLKLALEPIELPDSPDLKPEDVRKEAVKQLNSATTELEKRRDQETKDTLETMKRMLGQMESTKGQDPASQLADALKQGDFKRAGEELKKMQEQSQQAASQPAASPEMQKQQQEMQKRLEQLTQQMAQLNNDTQMQKELENKAGMSEQQAKDLMQQLSKMDPKEAAKQLQEQLTKQGMNQQQAQEMAQKMQQNQQAQQQLQQMAQQLAQAAQQLSQAQQQQQNGQSQQGAQSAAAQALANAADQLSQMELSEQMMNDLESQLAELNDLKDSVLKGQCQGNGQGDKPGDRKGGMGNQGPQAGIGYGSRVGKETVAFDMKAQKAKTRVQGGEIIAQILVDGPQSKGEATAEVKDAVAAAVRDAEDAVERGAIPRQYHGVAKKYFEALAGLNGQPAPAPPSPGPAPSNGAAPPKP
ncbi:MAG: hypothetical protein SF069_16750 [Phycisphaerae bacterium]|nr:hypothetical protein [Phycisphaerae bacterium]